ncbi:MAG: hypothetical protein VKJ85_02185 [Prochlorothrix sp.]|nr:hypothetical protein [Prochlorothrix sp.]
MDTAMTIYINRGVLSTIAPTTGFGNWNCEATSIELTRSEQQDTSKNPSAYPVTHTRTRIQLGNKAT